MTLASDPLLVLGLVAAIAWFLGEIDTFDTNWNKTYLSIGLMTSTGAHRVLITGEGFFPGWLWAALKRGRTSDVQILLLASLGFTLWHGTAITLETGFYITLRKVSFFLINLTILGLIWEILRVLSESILVPAVSHAVWDGIDCTS